MSSRNEIAAALISGIRSEGSSILSGHESVSLARELLRAGEWRLASELAEAVLSVVADNDQRLNAGLLVVEAKIGMGLFEDALRTAEGILEWAPDSDIRMIAWGRVLLARALVGLNRTEEAGVIAIPLRSQLLNEADSKPLGWVSLVLGQIAWREGDLKEAAALFTEGSVSARRISDRELEAMASRNLGIVQRQRCRWQEAADSFDLSLSIWKEAGNRALVSHILRAKAILEWKRGRLPFAREMAHESYRDAATTGTQGAHAQALELLALISLHAGELAECEDYLQKARQAIGDSDTSRPSLLIDEFEGDLRFERGEIEAALRLYDGVMGRALELVPDGDIVAEVQRRCAECHLALGRSGQALDLAAGALKHFRKLGDRYEEASCYRVVATAAAAAGDHESAVSHFHAGLELFADIETPYEWGRLWLAYGDWLVGSGVTASQDPQAAREAYGAARSLFDRMGAKRRLTESEERIGRLDSPETLSRTAAPWVSRSGSRPVARVVLDAPPPRGPGSRPLRHLRSEWAFDQFGVVTVDSAVLRLLEEVERLAKSRAPVLILGESGTGKELIAHAVHRHSGRPGQFLAINCAALPREVIQSELFGHVAGSFTGAARDKAGLFEVCARGTVFLDEIGEMPLDLQSHLLRFLESGESRRVGALKTAVVDTRVVAATNREAATLKRGEGFRKDLYYRLAHAVIELPPLRQRGPRDIELLAHHFLALACSEEGRQVSLSPAAIERMAGHSWPGNVREMKAEIFRRVVLARDGHVISPDELHLDDSDTPNGLDEELEQAERDRIQAALRQYPNRTEAARALGIPRTTLINRIRRMRLQG